MKQLIALIGALLLPLLLMAQNGSRSTAPTTVVAKRDAAVDTFHFVVYGDTRTHDNIHEKVVASAVAVNPRFILQTGDLVADGSDAQQWERFRRITAPIRNARIPYYPVRGNHDIGGTEFENEVPVSVGSNRHYYAFDYGRIRFLAIDTEDPLNPGTAQYEWLRDQLSNARKQNLFPIPFFHKAIYSVGRHGSDLKLQQVLDPLFQEANVKLVFQGHDHLYYRTVRNGITYVVTGGGGAPLYEVKSELLKPGDVAKSVHHFCVVDVQPSRIRVVAKGIDGNIIDDFDVPMLMAPEVSGNMFRSAPTLSPCLLDRKVPGSIGQ